MPPKGWKKDPETGEMVPPDGWAPPDPGICPACWPDGWPSGANRAQCVHGQWSRPAEE